MAHVQPKKPVGGAYGTFLAEKRPEFTKACAGQQASAVSKMAGEAWSQLSDGEKEPYQKRYEAAKAQFEKDMADFIAAGGVKEKGAAGQRKDKLKAKNCDEGNKGKEGKKKKDPDAPKQPAGGGYGIYLSENREEIKNSLPKDHKMTDVGKKAGELWRDLSEDAKKPYQEKYQEKQAEFKAAMEEFKKTHAADAGGHAGEADSKKKDDVTPKKRARAACQPDVPASPKKAKGRAPASNKKAPAPAEIVSDAMLEALKEAEGLGFASALRNLAARSEVVSLCLPPGKLLTTLKEADGLVNKAKALLLEKVL